MTASPWRFKKGETLGLVGESRLREVHRWGGRLSSSMSPPTEKSFLRAEDITHLKGAELKQFHKDVQMIFQDPYASLDPRMTIGEIIKEPMAIHEMYGSRRSSARQGPWSCCDIVGPQARPHPPLPARVFGRTEAAHLHRAEPLP